MAKIPVKKAGRMMLPPVCVSKLRGTWKSATAAAEPAEEPPGVRLGSCGLVVSGPKLVIVNSDVVVLPEDTKSENGSEQMRQTNRK